MRPGSIWDDIERVYDAATVRGVSARKMPNTYKRKAHPAPTWAEGPDPRAVDLDDRCAVLAWALLAMGWQEDDKKIIAALRLFNGDSDAAGRALKRNPEHVERLMLRALGELRFARRMREIEARPKRRPNNQRVRNWTERPANVTIHFYRSQQESDYWLFGGRARRV